jgi:anti-sigma factor RsiW
MTGRVLRFDPTAHKVVDALLPWYVNGTLEDDEREYVRVHLEECTQCRQEAVWLGELQAACRAAKSVRGATDPLRNLRRQLERRSTKRGLPTRLRHAWRDSNVWTRWGAAASLALIAVMLATPVLREAGEPALYRTLGASNTTVHPGGSLVVVFDPATTEAELRRVLREAGARLVDGPTRANAYILDVPVTQRQDALRTLRSERTVVLVERLDARDGP